MKGDGVVGRSAVAGGAAFSVAANSSVAAAWRLFILTDSPALAALVGRLPSLRGHVISQGDVINGAPNDKSAVGSTDAAGLLSAADSGRRLDDSSYLGVPSLTDVSLAIDLWMLGAADHVIAASDSTLTTFATRSIERNGRPHLLSSLTVSTGNKVIPVCGSACVDGSKIVCPCDELVYQRGRQQSSAETARCEAKRFALFSDAAMLTLVDSASAARSP